MQCVFRPGETHDAQLPRKGEERGGRRFAAPPRHGLHSRVSENVAVCREERERLVHGHRAIGVEARWARKFLARQLIEARRRVAPVLYDVWFDARARAELADDATLVEQASGDCPPAEGVLYELTDAQLDDLSRYETGYKRAVIGQGNMVALDDGTPVPNGAVTFVSRWDVTLRCEVPPRATYLRKLQRGAQTNLLSETYRSYLAGVEALPDGTPPPPSYGDSPSADLAKLAAAAALTLVLGAFV